MYRRQSFSKGSGGSRHVWFGTSLGGILEHYEVGERLKPGRHFDDLDDRFVFVKSTCLKTPKQAAGCLAVLQKKREWKTVLVLKVTGTKLLYQCFDKNNKLLKAIHDQVICFQRSVDFYYVGMYNRQDWSNKFTELISINPHDGCLDCSPTSPTVLRSSQQQTSKRQKRGHRGKRGSLRRMNGRKMPTQKCIDIFYDVGYIHSLHNSAWQNKKTVLSPCTHADRVASNLESLVLFKRSFYEIPKESAGSIPRGEGEAIMYLREKSVAEHQQFEIRTNLALRFVAVSTNEFESTKARSGVFPCSNFLYMESRTPTVDLPGVCVSCWKFDQDIEFFTMEDMVLSANIYGRGHGDRRICANVGGNLYAAERRSSQQSPNPEHGRGKNLEFSRYTRKDWCYPERQATLEAKLRDAGSKAINLFQDVFDNFLTFVGRRTGTLFIWTYGSADGGRRVVRKTLEGNERPRYKVSYDWVLNFMGFANTPHIDGDSMKDNDADRWMVNLLHGSTIYEYATRVRNMFGLGVQTTCGFNVSTSSSVNRAHLLAYFCQGQFAVPIKHCSAHLFFGWAFPHCTAIPVVHVEGRYHVNNDDLEEPLVIGAWGVCSNGGGQYNDPNILLADGRGDRDYNPDEAQNQHGEQDQNAPHQYNIENNMVDGELEGLTQDTNEILGNNRDHYDDRRNRHRDGDNC